MKIHSSIKNLVFICIVFSYSCQDNESMYKNICKAVCANPDTIIAKTLIDSLILQGSNDALSLLNYRLDRKNIYDVDPKVNQIQRIIFNQNNLIEVDKSDYSIDLDKVGQVQLETELFIRVNSKLTLNELNPEELFKIKSILKVKPKDYEGWYNQIRLIQILAKHYETIHETEKLYSTLLYGIYLIQSNKNSDSLSGLRDILARSITIHLMNEVNFEDYHQSENKLSLLISKRYAKTFNGLMREAFYQEELSTMDISNSYFQVLCEAEINAKTKEDSMTVLQNFGYYYSREDSTMSLKYFNEAIDKFDKPTCTMLYFRALTTALGSNLSPEEDQIFQRKLDYSFTCSDQIQRYVSFVRSQPFNENSVNNYRAEEVRKLIDICLQASETFPGRSTIHLQDYYLYNLNMICDLYFQGEHVEDELKELIINQFYEVRSQDLHRQKVFKDPINGVKDQILRKKISEILLSINNFKTLLPFDDPLYEDLFNSYVLEEKAVEIAKYHRKNIPIVKLDPFIKDKYLINFFRDIDNYIAYRYHNNELRIFRFDTQKVDSLLSKAYHDINNKEELNVEIKSLFNEIYPKGETKDLAIIADGILVNFPLSEVFTEAKNIYQFSNIAQILSISENLITLPDINIVSYSSDKKRSSMEKLKYPELRLGLKECKEISRILGITQDVIAGRNFSASNSIYSGKKMLHLSTHARSNTTNRYDNYIITRDVIQELYGFELYESNNLPEVVVFSACESGIGLHSYGAGVQTLSRAFLENGTQTVIKTLWKVNEPATAEIMVDMYTNWAKGMSLYKALEMTKESFKTHDEYSAPYYWAGFVLEGNPNVFLDTSSNN